MRRIVPITLMAVFVLPMLLSGVLISSFIIQQERIARELCVQRAVQEAKRSCHGECHLTKQLKQAEGATDQRTPVPPALRYEVLFAEKGTDIDYWVPAEVLTSFGMQPCGIPSDGFVRGVEGVPWV